MRYLLSGVVPQGLSHHDEPLPPSRGRVETVSGQVRAVGVGSVTGGLTLCLVWMNHTLGTNRRPRAVRKGQREPIVLQRTEHSIPKGGYFAAWFSGTVYLRITYVGTPALG